MSNTVTEATNTLTIADLRPYAMPDPVPVLPLSGWAWCFLILVVLVAAAWVALAVMRWRSHAYRRAGLRLLAELREGRRQAQSKPRALPVHHDINVILKRVALAAYPRERVATLSGQAWLTFLQKSCPKASLPESCGSLLTYPDSTDHTEDDIARLFAFASDWIQGHRLPGEDQTSP